MMDDFRDFASKMRGEAVDVFNAMPKKTTPKAKEVGKMIKDAPLIQTFGRAVKESDAFKYASQLGGEAVRLVTPPAGMRDNNHGKTSDMVKAYAQKKIDAMGSRFGNFIKTKGMYDK
jgi:hypothetical protein